MSPQRPGSLVYLGKLGKPRGLTSTLSSKGRHKKKSIFLGKSPKLRVGGGQEFLVKIHIQLFVLQTFFRHRFGGAITVIQIKVLRFLTL